VASLIVLKIILWLLAAVLITALVILCIPVFVNLRYKDSLEIGIRVLFIPFEVYPKEKFENNKLISFFRKLSAKFPKRKKEKPVGVSGDEILQKKKESPFAQLIAEQGFSGAVGLLLETARLTTGSLGKVLRTTVVDRFDLDIKIADEDAASTAISYGRWCAVIYPAAALILRYVFRYKKNIIIRPDYESEESTFGADIKLHVYPIAVACIAAALFAKIVWGQVKRTVKQKIDENMKAAENAGSQ